MADSWLKGLASKLSGEVDTLPVRAHRPYIDYLRASLPATWTVDARHIRFKAVQIERLLSGEIDRLAIHEPPRHAKTESSIRAVVQALEEDPSAWFLITGYSDRFAERLGRKARNIARARGIPLNPEKQAANEWETMSGGGVMTRGVGSPPTGVGFKGIYIDDPVKRRQDADSEVWQEAAWDWYSDDLYTRLEPGGWILLTMTLWHEADIGHRAVDSEPGRWTVVKLPAIAEEDDPLGRAPGEALWPERFDVPALERIKDILSQKEGRRSWEALYQQRPSPVEGLLFNEKWFHFVDADPPENVVRVRYWDLAVTSKTYSDRTAGVRIALEPITGAIWIEDVVFGRWEWPEATQVIVQTAVSDGKGVRQAYDTRGVGKGVIQELVRDRRLMGYPLVPTDFGTRDKVTMAYPVVNRAAQSGLFVRKDTEGRRWNADLKGECLAFPNGRHDDIVDGLSGAFNVALEHSSVPQNVSTPHPIEYTPQWYDAVADNQFGSKAMQKFRKRQNRR